MTKRTFFLFFVLSLFSSLLMAAGAADYFNYGNALYKKGDYKKAVGYYSQAAKLDKSNPSYYSAIASCYEKLGNKPMADKFARYSRTLAGNNAGGGGGADEKIRVSAFAGYTSASMTRVNALIDTDYALATASGATGTKQNIGNGLLIGAQGGYGLIKGLYAGPRLEYISVLGAKTTTSIVMVFPPISMEYSFEYSASMVDLMAGVSYYYPLQGQPYVLSGDLYFGYGMAGAQSKIMTSSGGTSNTITIPMDGSAFVSVISVSGDYKITNSISAGLTIGYRLATVAKMTVNNDVLYNGVTVVPKGYYMVDSTGTFPLSNTGTPMPFDFSGFIISANGNFSF